MEAAAWNSRPWEIPGGGSGGGSPAYVAIGGLTGAGKSTLVREVAKLLGSERPTMTIDERETHHPFLDRLFYDPSNFAFELQLNFMIQRCLLVRRWISEGISLVMERSHAEDPVFIRFLFERGLVTSAQHDAYMSVWWELYRTSPRPDALVILDVDPEESIRRLRSAESSGERPEEFADEEGRVLWIHGWSSHYRQRIAELEREPELRDRILVFRGAHTTSELAEVIVSKI